MRDKEGYARPPLADAVLELSSNRAAVFTSMALHWTRVGYHHLKMLRRSRATLTATTALVGGATLTTALRFHGGGAYDPSMWAGPCGSGSGEHYSFGNQVEAARRNWETLVRSLEPPPRRHDCLAPRRRRRAPRLCRRSEESGGADVGRQSRALLDQRQRDTSDQRDIPFFFGDGNGDHRVRRKRSPLRQSYGQTSPPSSTQTSITHCSGAGCRTRSGPAPMRWRRSHRRSMYRRRRRRRKSGAIGSRAGAARTPT